MLKLRIVAKCDDRCNIEFPNGKSYSGYVPRNIGVGGGDYLRLEIDCETGRVVGWSQLIKETIELMCDADILPNTYR